eukprot:scaffold330898_cov47-Prasinocladus_malaysianus.AAC.2
MSNTQDHLNQLNHSPEVCCCYWWLISTGVLSEVNQGATRRITQAVVELSDGSGDRHAFLNLHTRFLAHLQERTPVLSAGSSLRLTGTRPYGKRIPGQDEKPFSLLPTEQLVLVESAADASARSERNHCMTGCYLLAAAAQGLSLAKVAQSPLEDGARKVVQNVIIARVVSIGADEQGCSCPVCRFGSRQGRHRWVLLEDLQPSGKDHLPLRVPLMLFDQQRATAGGDGWAHCRGGDHQNQIGDCLLHELISGRYAGEQYDGPGAARRSSRQSIFVGESLEFGIEQSLDSMLRLNRIWLHLSQTLQIGSVSAWDRSPLSASVPR